MNRLVLTPVILPYITAYMYRWLMENNAIYHWSQHNRVLGLTSNNVLKFKQDFDL